MRKLLQCWYLAYPVLWLRCVLASPSKGYHVEPQRDPSEQATALMAVAFSLESFARGIAGGFAPVGIGYGAVTAVEGLQREGLVGMVRLSRGLIEE